MESRKRKTHEMFHRQGDVGCPSIEVVNVLGDQEYAEAGRKDAAKYQEFLMMCGFPEVLDSSTNAIEARLA